MFETPLSSSSLIAGGADQPQGKFGCVFVSLFPVVLPVKPHGSCALINCFLLPVLLQLFVIEAAVVLNGGVISTAGSSGFA